jgi:hypothetical protein
MAIRLYQTPDANRATEKACPVKGKQGVRR